MLKLLKFLEYFSFKGTGQKLQRISKMDNILVRSVEGEERLQISFTYKFEFGTERTFNMNRPFDETLSVSLARMCNNISSIIEKKNKRKKKKESDPLASQIETPTFNAVLLHGGKTVSGDVVNSAAWREGAVLKIGDKQFKVAVNPPTVKKIELPTSILAGFPISPKLDLEFASPKLCQYTWFKGSAPQKQCEANSKQSNGKADKPTTPTIKNWSEVENGFVFMPTNLDVGSYLKVVCNPANEGRTGLPAEAVSKISVGASPGYCPFEGRHNFTNNVLGPEGFRMVTYNILANFYADSDFSRGYLFPYCPPYALEIDYRKQLILKELIGYNADMICLQEVDRKVFLNDLQPVLDFYGLEGLYCEKTGETPEGTATFYRRDKFRLLSEHNIGIVEALQDKEDLKPVWDKVKTSDLLYEKLSTRTSKLQVLALECVDRPQDIILVGTTHLYFHPKAGNIRMLQTYACLKHLEAIRNLYQAKGYQVSTMYCGDLNSTPMTGVVQLLTTGKVASSHHDWYTGGLEEFVSDLDLAQPFKLTSACGYPDYTNFVTSFYGCLDYIFYEAEHLNVSQVVPLPSHEEVTQFTALPNPVFPSDHIALVCDLMWKT